MPWFGLASAGLEIDDLRHIAARENVMISANTLLETIVVQKCAHVAEADAGVRITAENPVKRLRNFAQRAELSLALLAAETTNIGQPAETPGLKKVSYQEN